MTNAFNLLDNMDGLCAGIAMIVGAALLIDLLPGGRRHAGVLRSALSRGSARRDRRVPRLQPASGVDLHGRQRQPAARLQLRRGHAERGPPAPGRSDVLSIVAAPVLVLLIPIFDTTLVTLSRWVSGRRGVARAAAITRRTVWSRSACRSARAVVAAVDPRGDRRRARRCRSITSAAPGRRWRRRRSSSAWCCSPHISPASASTTNATTRVQQGTVTPIVVEFMYKRRVAEVLLDFCLDRALLLRRLPAAVRGSRGFPAELRDVHQVAADRRRHRR